MVRVANAVEQTRISRPIEPSITTPPELKAPTAGARWLLRRGGAVHSRPPCAMHSPSGGAVVARQPCYPIPRPRDVGQWLCVPPFRMVCLDQALHGVADGPVRREQKRCQARPPGRWRPSRLDGPRLQRPRSDSGGGTDTGQARRRTGANLPTGPNLPAPIGLGSGPGRRTSRLVSGRARERATTRGGSRRASREMDSMRGRHRRWPSRGAAASVVARNLRRRGGGSSAPPCTNYGTRLALKALRRWVHVATGDPRAFGHAAGRIRGFHARGPSDLDG